MPLNLSLALIPVPDAQLLEALQSVVRELPNIRNPTFNWRVLANDNNNIGFGQIAQDTNVNRILEQRAEIFLWCSVYFQIDAQPNQQGGSLTIARSPDGWVNAELSLPDVWNDNTDLKIQSVVAVRKAFARYAKIKTLEAVAPELTDFYTRRESTLVQLEALNSRIIIENDQLRRDLERSLEDQRQRLEEAHQRRLETLEAEHRSKVEVLAKREADLDERKKLLDDRDNTHARRQIQQDVKHILKERNTDFSLTKKTIQKRLPSAIAFIVLICALVALSGWAFWATTQPAGAGQPFWFSMVRFALSFSALASSVVFYIRWQDRWAEAHAAEEFRLKRFDLDIARASWLVEVMLEWRTAEGTDIPKELIQKLANGLFDQVSTAPLIKHPAEEILGALLSSPAAVNLKFPGGDLSLDRKAVKEMNRKTD